MLVLPIVAYGYTGHVMDFPGTINNDFEHFMHHVLDITKSLAYHGFKKIILLNGHGSNMPNLDLVARRTNLETDAECVLRGLVEPADGRQGVLARAGGRASFPAAAPRLRAGDVAVHVSRRRQRAQGQDQERRRSASTKRTARSIGSTCSRPARPRSSRGPAAIARRGVLGEAELATAEKGRQVYEEAVKQLVRFVTWFKDRPCDVRRDRHRRPPTMPMPWGQRPARARQPCTREIGLRDAAIAVRLACLMCLAGAATCAGRRAARSRMPSSARPTPSSSSATSARCWCARCYKCHGDMPEPKGGLKLTSREAILKGGESGPAAVAGKAGTRAC